MIDLAAETDRLLDFAGALAPPRGRLRLAAGRRDTGPRAPARAVDHDADDALFRARSAARAPWGLRPGRARARFAARRLPRRRARRLVRAGRRLDRQARVRARLRRAGGGQTRATRSCWARRSRCSTRRFWDEGRRRARRCGGTAGGPRWSPTAGRTRTCTASRPCSPPRDPLWRERARRVTQRLVVDNHPRLNEHFDAAWRPLPDYNIVEPAHPFRPYGATIGHWFEWARLAYTLDAGWFEADARRLFAAGVRDGWDGSGFVYTVDWDGTAGRRRPPALGAVRGDRRRRRARARTRCRPSGGRSPSALHRPRATARGGTSSIRPTAREHRLGRQARRLSRAAGDAHPARSGCGVRWRQAFARSAEASSPPR